MNIERITSKNRETTSEMFPREQEAAYQDALRGFPPPRLPRLQTHPSGLGRPSFIENLSSYESLAPANTSPDLQRYGDRPSGRSVGEEAGMSLRPTLPSVATLLPPPPCTDPSLQPQLDAEPQRRPQAFTPAYTVSSAPFPTVVSTRLTAGLSGLSAFADPQLIHSSRSVVSPSPQSRRWSPYGSTSTAAGRTELAQTYAMPWDELEFEPPSHRRRRTSPRRRLAASKAQARALQMATQGRHFGRYDIDQAAYGVREVPFVPPPPMPLVGVSLPLSLTLRPPSSHTDEGFDTSPSKKNSRYLREMDRRSILARLDRGEKQSALAKEFRVTRAAICNLDKHRDLVLSRQHEDPLAKHPKKTKRKEDEAEVEDAEILVQKWIKPGVAPAIGGFSLAECALGGVAASGASDPAAVEP